MDNSSQPKYVHVQSPKPERPNIQERVDELNNNHRNGVVDNTKRGRNLTDFLNKNLKK